MKSRAVIKQSGKWWIGWLVDLPGVNAQERTRRRLLESLRIGAEDLLTTPAGTAPGESVAWVDVPEPQCVAESAAPYGTERRTCRAKTAR